MWGSSQFLLWQAHFKAWFVNILEGAGRKWQWVSETFCRNETSEKEVEGALWRGLDGWRVVWSTQGQWGDVFKSVKLCGPQPSSAWRGESGVKSAGTASCASIPTLRAAHRVIDSCAQVTAHKSKHIPLRQTLTSPTWNFHARKSSGQVSAEALRESSVSPERAVLPGLLVTTLPPSAAGRKSSRHRARRVPATEGPSQPPPAPGSSCGNAGYFIKCFPTSALSKMIPVGRDFSHRNTCL